MTPSRVAVSREEHVTQYAVQLIQSGAAPSKQDKLRESKRIALGLLAEQRAWASDSRVNRLVSEQREIIERAQAAIDKIQLNHLQAPEKIAHIQGFIDRVDAALVVASSADKIRRLARLSAQLNSMTGSVDSAEELDVLG